MQKLQLKLFQHLKNNFKIMLLHELTRSK